MPHILYIGQAPTDGNGSPVIVLRHLQRLAAAGWQVSVITERAPQALGIHPGWTVLTLPLRRPWWPPLRHRFGLSRAIRTWLLAGEARRLMSTNPPDAVLGYLAAHDDFLAEIACRYAHRTGTPLTLLVHDDAAAFTTLAAEQRRLRRRHGALLRGAHRRWFVSPELAEANARPVDTQEVLPPLPAGWPRYVSWNPEFAVRPRVYYACFIWPAQFPLLEKIATAFAASGVGLVLLTRETPALRAFLHASPAQHRAPFATNHEALVHLATHAAGILVSYAESVAVMPWIATSFPSKLVEHAQLGLPCAIVAPATSAVGRWARAARSVDFFAPDEITQLAAWARALRSEASWQQSADRIRHVAASEFNPETIQSVFAAGLLRN